jgi:hypothetical protein
LDGYASLSTADDSTTHSPIVLYYRTKSPTNANLIYTFQPIFTALFAWLLLGETMGPAGFVGGGIIASSVYLVASTSFGEQSENSRIIEDDGIGKPIAVLPPSSTSASDLSETEKGLFDQDSLFNATKLPR